MASRMADISRSKSGAEWCKKWLGCQRHYTISEPVHQEADASSLQLVREVRGAICSENSEARRLNGRVRD